MAFVEIWTGWLSAVMVTIQDTVVNNISLTWSLHTLHHAVKDGQYCLLHEQKERRTIAEFQARVG